MFNLSSNIKLFLILGALVAAQVFWSQTIMSERAERIDQLTATVQSQASDISAKDQQISELERYKFVEEGYKKIIEAQAKEYRALEANYESLKNQTLTEIRDMSEEDRSKGLEIHNVWKLYMGDN